MSSFDIRYMKEYLVPRAKHWGQRPSLVVVFYHVLLYFLNHRLGLFDCCFYPFHKLIYYFQSGGSLPEFEAHMESLSSIKQEQGLLDRCMHMVVVLEFCHG